MTVAVIDKYKYMLARYCRNLDLKSNYPGSFSESSTLFTEVWEVPGHRFELEYESIEIHGLEEQRIMWVLLNAMRKGAVPFTWVVPLHSRPTGLANQNPTITTAAPGGSRQVKINVNNSAGDFLGVGSMIKFSNHSKVYLVEDIEALVNPWVTLNAPLAVSLVTTDTMITRDVAMRLIRKPDSEILTYSRKAGNLDAGFSMTLVEKL